MLFPTVNFAIFFFVVFAVSWFLRRRTIPWRVFIIAASWFFYGYWDARFVLLLAGSTVGNYLAGRMAFAARTPAGDATRASRNVVRAAVVANLALLGWFKYYGFFATSLVNTLHDLGLGAPVPLIQVTLPIGISFFTFQAISYVVDIGRGAIRPMRALDFATYLSFFPHLVAGPIVRASEFAPQLAEEARPRTIAAGPAFFLILGGLFKKVVISSYLASEVVDPVFAVPGQHSSPEILLAIYGYAIQIFADFSGYTDIAIGLALLLGFRFPQNFDAPYTATSLQDFWRRWHMTLSRWLRDYLYIGLGGNRGSRLFTARNLMLTMVLGGLWHGAAWTFVIWGAIHGTWLVAERWTRELIGRRRPQRGVVRPPSAWAPVAKWLVTFHVVCLGWVFFRAETPGTAMELLRRLVTAGGESPLVTPLAVCVVAGALAAQFVPRVHLERLQVAFTRLAPVAQGVTLAAGLLMIDALGPEGVAPFIYFRF